ncbi:hypothetical protein ASA1KI_21060 [Opitutales bacterium ASA1]|uniref:acetyltransferase n=1 Tax=Congregicoccus parvus TaxID=3081749 RepID=UPI002B316FE5|nr:hypothetical protein ASA1KI_21060 [Opitutales bacterium ASA1]
MNTDQHGSETEGGNVEFDEWAKVELFGHVTLVGRVTKAPIGDFLRIDVPKPDGTTAWTKLVNPKAVYAVTPITRDLAIALVNRHVQAPVQPYELPEAARPAAAPSTGHEFDDGQWDRDDDDEDES